jgi:SET domain-containing protein
VGEVLAMKEAMARSDHSYQFELQIRNMWKTQGQVEWPEAKYMVDGRLKGNVSRFINHNAESPNLVPQMVFCDGHIDPIMPNIALFAQEKIEAFTELCYDYGPEREEGF